MLLVAAAFGIGLAVGFILGWIVSAWMRPPRPRGVSVAWIAEGASLMANIKAGESKSFGVSVVDANGNPARVQNPQWKSEPDDVLTITASEPPVLQPGGGPRPSHPIAEPQGAKARAVNTSYFATVKAGGSTGAGLLTFTADADLGEGTKELIGSLNIVVTAGEAVAVEIEEIPEPPPPSAQPRR